MKTRILAMTVAFLCCGFTTSFGQVQLLPARPITAPRLVSTQSDLLGDTDLAEVADEASSLPLVPATKPSIPNPFNFVPAEVDDLMDVSPSDLPSNKPAVSEDARAASSTDPNSLPVGRNVRQREVVDTIVDYSMLDSIPNAATTPVYWNHHTPNPIADTLLRQDCVNGLWDSYPAQRAAECRRMQERLAGHHACCGRCGAANSCGACPCGTSAMPRNRYREQQNAGCPTPGACDNLGSGADCAATTAVRSTFPVSTANSQGRPTNVASLPATAVR